MATRTTTKSNSKGTDAEFADACRTVGDSQPWVGIEHEFLCHDESGRRVDFRGVIDSLALGPRNLVPTDGRARWLPTGALLTADKMEAEIATPPAPLAPGFATSLDGWAAWERAQLARWVPGIRLTGDSTHLNVTLPPDVDPDDVADLYVSRFAVGQMLLMDRPTSPGLLVRPRPHRLEIGGEYAVGSALRAAVAYAAGATLACVEAVRSGQTAGLPPALLVRVERNVIRYGWYVSRFAFGGDLYRDGRGAWLATVESGLMTAGDAMLCGWRAARRHTLSVLDDEDMRDGDKMVAGEIPIPVERDGPEHDHDVAEPVAPVSVFGRVLAARSRPGYDLAPVMLTWELAVFLIADEARSRSAFAAVPGRALAGFIGLLDTGALDGPVLAYLRKPPSGRRLLRPEQATESGLFDELGLRASLLAPERDYWGRPMHLTLRRPLPRSFRRRLAA